MKNALFLTGAAARISQEVALVDKLIEKHQLDIDPDKLLLAGFSSGALNVAAINACFRKKDPLLWDHYYKEEVLFKITTKNVYKQKRFIPLNTKPLLKTISNFTAKASLIDLKDFEFKSYILAFSYLRLSTLWASNLFHRHEKIDINSLLMATSAIPIIFEDQSLKLNGGKRFRFSRGRYADGGTGGSFRRFEFYLKKYIKQHGQLDKMYIVSPMREVSPEDYEEVYKMLPVTQLFNLELKDLKLFKIFLEMISQNGFDSFVKRFYKWTLKHKVANNIYICIPGMTANYPLLKFDKQKEQYYEVCAWADKNPDKIAIPIEEYIKRFEHTPLIKTTQIQAKKLIHWYHNLITRKS